ncbi:MAG: hypothetical protein ABIJ39_13210 [Chloroflexota bacterium]
MKKNARSLIVVFLSIILSFACITTPTPTPPTSDPNEIATAVAATLTAQAGVTPGEITTTPASPTETPVVPLPDCLPAHPGQQNLPLPAGLTAGLGETVMFYDTQAVLLGNRPLTGITWIDPQQAHFAGNLAAGLNNLPIIYFTLQGGGTLRSNIANIISDLTPAPNLISIQGAEGNAFIAYATIDMMGGWVNRLYAANFPQLPGAQPILTWTPPPQGNYGNAIEPLAIQYHAGQAEGIWFTYTMEGIGNINFPPFSGLTYLDLATNIPVEFIPTSDALGGISPDQTLIAYGPGQGGAPGLINNGFTLRNLLTCQETYFPYNPSSNLGGGYMVFSPDNQLVAWLESDGLNPMEANFRLRVARTNGTSLFDAPVTSLSSLFGGEVPTWLKPVGWVANHILVLEIYSNTTNQSYLVFWAPDPAQLLDPALGANQSVLVGTGDFMGFIYP